MEWMFSLSSQLAKGEDTASETACPVKEEETEQRDADEHNSQTDTDSKILHGSIGGKDSKFPSYDFTESASSPPLPQMSVMPRLTDIKDEPSPDPDTNKESSRPAEWKKITSAKSETITFAPVNGLYAARDKSKNSKRKGRQLSCSSQESQEDAVPGRAEVVETGEGQVRSLLEMFPAACTMEARHCLQLSNGDLDLAAQLIIDRQETGQALRSQAKGTLKKNAKVKKSCDYKLDDASLKSSVLQKYSFIDTEEDKKTYKPPPLKGEAKKLVRYRDGQIVSVKGERFSEVKKKDSEEMKETYVNLKPARKYRFH
ncbi:CUE domain-containing protein 2-A isoform X3 [Aplysia californica]|nr:CUE domain-containing protein 2-A isoform X3 [Aplysia californica]